MCSARVVNDDRGKAGCSRFSRDRDQCFTTCEPRWQLERQESRSHQSMQTPSFPMPVSGRCLGVARLLLTWFVSVRRYEEYQVKYQILACQGQDILVRGLLANVEDTCADGAAGWPTEARDAWRA
jgi:hypothetical protein